MCWNYKKYAHRFVFCYTDFGQRVLLFKEESVSILIPVMPDTGRILTYASGVNVIIQWNIDNFFTLPEKDDEYYTSPDFFFDGETWYLSICPNGLSKQDSSRHVNLRLWKYRSNRSNRQAFSLSLRTINGESEYEKNSTIYFDNWNRRHEFIRFISRSELSRRRSELVPDGVLTVVCAMKGTGAESAAGNDSEHAYVEVPTQTVEAFTQTVEEKSSASGSSTNSHEKKVLHDLKELFLKKEDCDVTIKVEGSEFLAHRVILKARSPVFASTFRHDMKENATGVLEIEDCNPSTFSDFLCFLYCGDVGIISQENVFGLFTAADKYQVLDLRTMCLEFIKKNITVNTFCETITLALRHSETELIKLSTDYFKNNVPKIIVTVKWQTFLAENPTESNELLVKFFVPNSS